MVLQAWPGAPKNKTVGDILKTRSRLACPLTGRCAPAAARTRRAALAARAANAAHAALAALPLLLAAPTAQAQDAAQRVDVVGVSPVPGLDLPRDPLPAPVQTARAADIERSNAIDLAAFMNRQFGSVHINDMQNHPFQPDVNFRGFTASPLLGAAQGLSVYLDGVRLNQPFGDVVSWDLVPKSAIASITLMPGSNPLFGLNTLGGALAIQTKDGRKHPGSSVQMLAGAHRRRAVEFETGGSQADAAFGDISWFVTGNRFHDNGWRSVSPSDVSQLFGKFDSRLGSGQIGLTAALADNTLNGNGLQEQRLLARDYRSVYTQPDTTQNRSLLLNLAASQALNDDWSVAGQVYWRRIHSASHNDDSNETALDQPVYQPDAAERAALAAAGYSAVPASGENAGNRPFPKWRCIANALLRAVPGETGNSVLNQSRSAQSNLGLAGQLSGQARWAGWRHQGVAGAAVDWSRCSSPGLRAGQPQSRPRRQRCRRLRRRCERRHAGRRAVRHPRRSGRPHPHLEPVCQ